jgi:subtilisin family serine protease
MEGDDNLSFLTPRFVVSFRDGVTQSQIDELDTKYNAQVIERLGYVNCGYLYEAKASHGEQGPVALSNFYFESGLCDFAHPDFIERRQWRGVIGVGEDKVETKLVVDERDGDYISRQWHLALAKVIDAWGVTKGDSAVTVAVLDDGIDVGHPEFAGKLGPQFDFENKVADASPKASDDKHGTSCAGVAAARGVKASGAAPGCKLMAIRTPTMLGVADEANMFRWASDKGADVISCSWGPPDGAGAYSLVDSVRAAIHYCLTAGRGGKGIPVFFAAGNGNELVSNDGYASNPDVMAIAASSEHDMRSPYSDFGPEIFICAPSSGDTAAGDRKIFTTDRRGPAGYNTGDSTVGDAAGDYTSRFGGTSSACPLVAGIAGLIISADRSLTRDRVKDILKTTAEKIGGASLYDSAGHCDKFGFGRVNALAATTMAAYQATHSGTGPTISGPPKATAGDSPAFTVERGAHPFYAVELATERDLFIEANSGNRSDSNYYESWSSGFSSDTIWRAPADAWTKLAISESVYYIAHFADDLEWANYEASADADKAPFVTITGRVDGECTLVAPVSASADMPPEFRATFGNQQLFAVELATSKDLMDDANVGRRTASNWYGSWSEGLSTEPVYTPPPSVWRMLADAGVVYYRGHFASDEQWANYTMYPVSGVVPSIVISGMGGGGVGGNTVISELKYPSGAIFRTVDRPQDGVDYSDPVANGMIPLIEVLGRESEQLSANFRVNEMMAKGARYARIAPALVEGLQAVRMALGKPMTVESAYRHPALNTMLNGDPQSEHLTGRAAVVRALGTGVKPLDIAKAALESIKSDIGIGLGPTSVHIDIGGSFSTWVYQGAEMTDDQFATWARALRTNRATRTDERLQEVSTRGLPTIDGPELLDRTDPAPAFRINQGLNPYFAVEVATDWRLFGADRRDERNDDNFYGTWGDPNYLLLKGSQEQNTVFRLPTDVWLRLGQGIALFYRILTVSDISHQWSNLKSSTPDDDAANSPRIRLVNRKQSLDDAGPKGLAWVLGSHAMDDYPWDGAG